jgi:hypothetical protein
MAIAMPHVLMMKVVISGPAATGLNYLRRTVLRAA